ncbi:MAG: tetratricopeptide repeat protein, partial [Desulfobacterales bacterium]|nr:tetratricopeptide repeat protein [Desulfobacterales bacterium]
MRYSSKLLICLCLTLAIVLVYGQVIDFDFVGFDDELYVSGNRHLKNGLNPENVAWAFTFHGYSYWQPLTRLSHILDYQLFGLMSGWHHLSNLSFHLLNTLLLFLALKKMTGALWRSAFVAAMFALHPLNVESVAWVAERKNVLSAFFWMLTLLAYIWYTKQPELYRYLTVIIVFMLGLMAKPVLISLPFVLLLLDYWPLGRMRFGKSINAYPKSGSIVRSNYQWSIVFRMVLEKTPFFILSAGTVCLSTLSVYHLGSIVSTDTVPMSLRVANALCSYMSYMGKIIWPHNLAVFYPYPDSLPLWQPSVSALFLAVISATVYINKRRCPYLAVGWFWYIVTLIPASGLMQAGLWPAMADRFTYIPSIGLFMLIAWGLPDVLGKGRYKNMMLTMLAGAVLLCFMICTVLQTGYWKNDIALFQHALKVTDNNWPSHYNLGVAWYERGKFDEAVLQFEQVLKIKPANAGARNNLAKILFNHGKFEEAAMQLK